jgi:putative holliday junction resolvase
VRTAALDFGTTRIGVAVSDELGRLAHPRPYLDGKNLSAALERLQCLVRDEHIEQFVVGLPRHLNGREGTSARRARRFAGLLQTASGIPVVLVDEWLTTREAQGRLSAQGLNHKQSRERIDSAAAAVLLQGWLDARRGGGGDPDDEEHG